MAVFEMKVGGGEELKKLRLGFQPGWLSWLPRPMAAHLE